MQGHKHNDTGHTHTYTYTPRVNDGTYATVPISATRYAGNPYGVGTSAGKANLGLPAKYNDTYGEPRVGNETRPENSAIQLWQRIS